MSKELKKHFKKEDIQQSYFNQHFGITCKESSHKKYGKIVPLSHLGD